MSSVSAITVSLFFVIDALGHLPVYLQLLKPYDRKTQRKIAVRELCFALCIMILFHYFGQLLLSLLDVSLATVQLAGGIILFLIAIRLIFSEEEEHRWKDQPLVLFPIATPLIAGPSVLAVIMVFAQKEISDWLMIEAIIVAWFLSSLVFLFAQPIYRLIKPKGLEACQRLMGLIVALIAVELFLQGIKTLGELQ